jgi:hypothetical protein
VPGLSAAAQGQQVLAHGMATAFGVAAILNVASLLVILALIRTRKLAPQRPPFRADAPVAASSSGGA